MRQRFAKFNLELHPEKTRIVAFSSRGRGYDNQGRHRPHTFDFLDFTHYRGKSLKGNLVLCHKTSSKRLRRACKELAMWLKMIRSSAKLKEWWPMLQAKLRGHYQYYGISGNSRALAHYCYVTDHLILKWLNRRCQKVSFTWKGYRAYLKHYPFPQPRIVYRLYTPSSDS